MVALQVLLCAGWVHRDISVGNILAYHASKQDSCHVKLADFEFAKALTDVDCLQTEQHSDVVVVSTLQIGFIGL